MKQTVADLMPQRNYPRPDSPSAGMAAMSERAESQTEQVFTVSLVIDPNEVEILDQRVVIERRVIARSRREALDKCGFTVKG